MEINLKDQGTTVENTIKARQERIKKTGYFPMNSAVATSLVGGHPKPIAWGFGMAGTEYENLMINQILRLEVPRVANGQRLKINFKTIKVPCRRIMKNYDEFIGQAGGTNRTKIEETPNTAGKIMPIVYKNGPGDPKMPQAVPLTDTEAWRDSWISAFIPRLFTGMVVPGGPGEIKDKGGFDMPKMEALLFRTWNAIWNDVLRHKAYQPKIVEYNGDTLTDEEWNSYLPWISKEATSTDTKNLWTKLRRCNPRGRNVTSYYNDYTTTKGGVNSTLTADTNWDYADWLAKIAEARQQVENEQLTEYEVAAKLRGVKVAKEGRVRVLRNKDIGINYTAVTQNTYNNIEAVDEDFRLLGTQGAYSITQIKANLGNFISFDEDSFIIVVAQLTTESVYETGINRLLLNCKWDQKYRPEMANKPYDVLYSIESGCTNITPEEYEEIVGYKRYGTEYCRLPDCISGDMTTNPYYAIADINENSGVKQMTATDKLYRTKKEYQMFQTDRSAMQVLNEKGEWVWIKTVPWLDWTDILLNECQAKPRPVEVHQVESLNGTGEWGEYVRIAGTNQAYMYGTMGAWANIPIAPELKENFRKNGQIW